MVHQGTMAEWSLLPLLRIAECEHEIESHVHALPLQGDGVPKVVQRQDGNPHAVLQDWVL